MAKSNSITATYEALPKILKLIIQLFLGWPVSAIYRIVRYLETQNLTTLIAGLLCIPFGIVGWVVDFVTELLHNKIDVFAD